MGDRREPPQADDPPISPPSGPTPAGRMPGSATVFAKNFADRDAMERCLRNHALVRDVAVGRVPEVLWVDRHTWTIGFEFLAGRAVTDDGDLEAAAAVIGRMHCRWRDSRARYVVGLDHPSERVFSAPRRAPVEARLRVTQDHGNLLHRVSLDRLWMLADARAQCFYKDCNALNFILRGHRVSLVDFDTLTVAPAGYDLAKLLLTVMMRRGNGSAGLVRRCLGVYNAELCVKGGAPCGADRLLLFMELHWLLTMPYMAKNGYQVPWPALRERVDSLVPVNVERAFAESVGG
jgi:hypothetical protein